MGVGNMIGENFFILSGAPGSGKSTLLQNLKTEGFRVVPEPARQILSEQRGIDGNGLPEKDARLFVELMLSRAIYEFDRSDAEKAPVFFDRGIPDTVAYAAHFGFDYSQGQNAAEKYRYNSRVFFAPAWEQIYTCDDERRMSFEAARQFGVELRSVYQQAGYELIELPFLSAAERTQFIIELV